jgi:hypothetical protein
MIRCSSAPVPGFLLFGAMVVSYGIVTVTFRIRSRDRKSIPTTDLGAVFFFYLWITVRDGNPGLLIEVLLCIGGLDKKCVR